MKQFKKLENLKNEIFNLPERADIVTGGGSLYDIYRFFSGGVIKFHNGHNDQYTVTTDDGKKIHM